MARTPTWSELPENAVAFMAGGQTSIVATIDAAGRPDTTLMTWVVARDAQRVALCVDTRSRTFENLCARPELALEVLGDGVTLGVRGHATVEKQQMESTPFPCAIVLVTVAEVRDHAAPGTQFFGPRYVYDEDKQHRHDFERRVFEELRGDLP